MDRVGTGVALVICCLPLIAKGGDSAGAPGSGQLLTGNIRVDLFTRHGTLSGSPGQDFPENENSTVQKSPWLAAGLSLLVPGTGEFYAESYWKAAAFFALEVAAWTIAYTYDQKGDDQSVFFQGFANEHWSVVRYAQWSLDNAGNINPTITDPGEYQVFDIEGNVNWAELNRLERAIGEWYSHTLPPFGEQQYYELIGKYQQYYQGWDDADPSLTTYDAIDARLASSNTRFVYYAGERGKANDFYNTASTAVTLAIVNHLISAIDAAWSASLANSRMQARVGLQRVPRGDTYTSVPSLKLSFRL
jgi:hypothetical protein